MSSKMNVGSNKQLQNLVKRSYGIGSGENHDMSLTICGDDKYNLSVGVDSLKALNAIANSHSVIYGSTISSSALAKHLKNPNKKNAVTYLGADFNTSNCLGGVAIFEGDIQFIKKVLKEFGVSDIDNRLDAIHSEEEKTVKLLKAEQARKRRKETMAAAPAVVSKINQLTGKVTSKGKSQIAP